MSAANGTDISPPDAGGGLNGAEATVLGGALGGAVTEATVGLERAWDAIVSAPGQAVEAISDVVPVDLPFDTAASIADPAVLTTVSEVVVAL